MIWFYLYTVSIKRKYTLLSSQVLKTEGFQMESSLLGGVPHPLLNWSTWLLSTWFRRRCILVLSFGGDCILKSFDYYLCNCKLKVQHCTLRQSFHFTTRVLPLTRDSCQWYWITVPGDNTFGSCWSINSRRDLTVNIPKIGLCLTFWVILNL